jgi:hypothetical protein
VESTLTQAELAPILGEAIRRWSEAILLGGGSLDRLNALSIQVADLEGQTLGLASDDSVWIDTTAAGHGWFIDPTPTDDSEFRASTVDGALRATPASPAAGSMDLLSVVTHELGHVLGLDSHELFGTALDTGLRLTPEAPQAPAGLPASSRSDLDAMRREYAISILAAEGWVPDDEEDDEFTITEIPIEPETAPL